MTGKVKTSSFEDSALLRCLGFEFERATVENNRVSLWFLDEEDKAEEVFRLHNNEGVQVNSRDFVDALAWAKSLVFSTRSSRTSPTIQGGY